MKSKAKNKPVTREEILQLQPGPKTDQLVAEKVMGWKQEEIWLDFEGRLWRKVGCANPNEPLYVYAGPWSPSTDIAAAWEVVEALVSRGWHFELCTTEITGAGSAVWRVSFWCHESPEGLVLATEIPLAICRAALQAVMKPKE